MYQSELSQADHMLYALAYIFLGVAGDDSYRHDSAAMASVQHLAPLIFSDHESFSTVRIKFTIQIIFAHRATSP